MLAPPLRKERMRPPSESPRRSRELSISYAVFEGLSSRDWPLVFLEVMVPGGLSGGRVDVAAASKGFHVSAAVEVKSSDRAGSAEDQLFDGRRAAEYVYFAAPREGVHRTEIPKGIGILEAGFMDPGYIW